MSHGANDPVHHMNTDHAQELLDVARAFGGHADISSARAEGVDPRGIDVVVQTPSGPAAVRLEFAEMVLDYPVGLRAAFSELTSQARAWLVTPESPGRTRT
ncbi:MAG: DUF2470 domain-containing protein [Acidimicrobiales bacterium]